MPQYTRSVTFNGDDNPNGDNYQWIDVNGVEGQGWVSKTVDLVNNTLGNIQRGANGTAKQFLIPQYAQVYGLLNENKLRDTYYDQVWNSYVYNPTLGDPLQISITPPALFLQSDAI